MNLAYADSQKLYPVEKTEVSFASFEEPLDRPFDEEPHPCDDYGGIFRSCVAPEMQESGDSNDTGIYSGELSFSEDADVDQFLLDTSIATDRLRIRVSKSNCAFPMETTMTQLKLGGLFGLANNNLEESSETVTNSAASMLWAEDESNGEFDNTQN